MFLTAYDAGSLLPFNQFAYNVAKCNPTDTTLLEMLQSSDNRKQKLAFAIIDCLIAENMPVAPTRKAGCSGCAFATPTGGRDNGVASS